MLHVTHCIGYPHYFSTDRLPFRILHRSALGKRHRYLGLSVQIRFSTYVPLNVKRFQIWMRLTEIHGLQLCHLLSIALWDLKNAKTLLAPTEKTCCLSFSYLVPNGLRYLFESLMAINHEWLYTEFINVRLTDSGRGRDPTHNSFPNLDPVASNGDSAWVPPMYKLKMNVCQINGIVKLM